MRKKDRLLEIVREFNDRGVQWLMETPENVSGLMAVLDNDLRKGMDFKKIQQVSTTLIPEDLRKQEADLIFRLPYREGRKSKRRQIMIYLLIEHQSLPDRLMAFRLLMYMVLLWDRERREWQAKKVPVSRQKFTLIIPVVLYTGSRKWDTPIDMRALMDLTKRTEAFVPSFETLLLNLRETTLEELVSPGHPFGWVLHVMQKEKAPRKELESAIEGAMEHLRGMADEEQDAWEKAIQFLLMLVYHRREAEEGQEISKKIQQEVRRSGKRGAVTMAKTWAETLEQKGRVEGRVEAKQDALLELMAEKFGALPAGVTRRVRALQNTEALDRHLKSFVRAGSLLDMGLGTD